MAETEAFASSRALAADSPLALCWAVWASTAYRLRRGEGALIAINLSIIALAGSGAGTQLAQSVVSILTLALMYAYNDLHDAPEDSINPKKDQRLIATYLAHRVTFNASMFGLKLATVALAFATLGVRPALAAATVMTVNFLYSTLFKGVPVMDVVWCGIWGALYTYIVTTSPVLLLFVGLMTGVCHLYQTLDDRISDERNGIVTTAVRSSVLSKTVLFSMCLLMSLVAYGQFGAIGAITAYAPFVLLFLVQRPGTGWLLTKAYYGALWLSLLGSFRAAL
ncbi:MAG TPA: UbiA family prenyltransferase [Candidatus Binatia bacterium]|nr:UbiA family prenyltransferase [Candidatus Binatia bacterium]